MDNYLSGIKSIADYNNDKFKIEELGRKIDGLKIKNKALSKNYNRLRIRIANKVVITKSNQRENAIYLINRFKDRFTQKQLIKEVSDICFLSKEKVKKIITDEKIELICIEDLLVDKEL